MDVLRISDDGVERRDPEELGRLLESPGIVWVDVPSWDDDTAAVLSGCFGIHERAAADCARRNPVPKVHVYAGHVFVVLHAPERGARGHVHYVELDQFIGPDWLITVHGPLNPAVRSEVALDETRAVARRLETGWLHPGAAADLSFALVTALTGRMRDLLAVLTEEVWLLERQVTGGEGRDPEQFLEELFAVRHGLLAVRNMAGLSNEVYGRMVTLDVWPGAGHALLLDLEDQFRRISAIAQGQHDYLQGVIEFYQARTNTKMTIAAERLAVIAAVTLPVTALSSVLGMNVIVNQSTHVGQLVVILAVMGVMSTMLLIWARRKGWW